MTKMTKRTIIYRLIVLPLIIWGGISYHNNNDQWHIFEAEFQYHVNNSGSDATQSKVTELMSLKRELEVTSMWIGVSMSFGGLVGISLIIYTYMSKLYSNVFETWSKNV